MRDMVAPFVCTIVRKESDRMIRDVELKVKMKTLTLKGIQELLQPQRVMDKYREHAPFTWELLETFAATPNKFRRQRERDTPANSRGDEDDDWEDDLFCTTFDNINIYLRKHQRRVTNKHSMIHATNCAILAIDEEDLDVQRVENLDTKLALRGQRAEATFRDILPSEDDDEHLVKAFTCIIVEILVHYTPESKSWKEHANILDQVKQMMPSDRPLKVKKTDARPFGVFDINEGSKKGIVMVMEAICEQSTLPENRWSAKTRLVLGDWLTSNNLRGARRNRADNINSMERVEYVEELSSLWHYALPRIASCELISDRPFLIQLPSQRTKDFWDG